jgi:hypothetical protein
LSFISPPNFEIPLDANADNHYLSRIQVSDAYHTTAFDININVVDTVTGAAPNTPPQLLQNHYNLEENTTTIGKMLVNDAEENPLTIQRNGGDDIYYIQVSSQRGLYFLDAPNFEQPDDKDADNQYQATMIISDG